jgi:hypothetical protein
MKPIRAILGIMLLFPAAFCGFGFLASFESVAHALAWRVGYAGLGITLTAGAILLLSGAFRSGGNL